MQSPDTKVAGMGITSGTAKVLATNVQYSLGSNWFPVSATSQTYDFTDDLTKKVLTTRVETPPPNPLGFSNILIGLQKGSVMMTTRRNPRRKSIRRGVLDERLLAVAGD